MNSKPFVKVLETVVDSCHTIWMDFLTRGRGKCICPKRRVQNN